MLSRAIQAIHRLPYFPGQWRAASMLRKLLPGGIGLFDDRHAIRYFVHDSSHIGHGLATGHEFEADIDAVIPARPLGLVVDAGCNAGTFALPLAGRARRVVCIDADAELIALLQRTLTLNGIANVETLWAAVASQGDTVSFNVAAKLKDLSSRDPAMLTGRDAFTTRTVPAISLARIAERHGPIDLLKIDIEGFSGDAIRSLGPAIADVRFLIAEPSPDIDDATIDVMRRAGLSVSRPLEARADLPDHVRYTVMGERKGP